MIALAIAALDRPLVLVISNRCRRWRRPRFGSATAAVWQMPADRAFALR